MPQLQTGKREQGDLAAGQSATYELVISEPTYLWIEVVQLSADVVVRISGEGGDLLIEQDYSHRRGGFEQCYLVLERAGRYHLQVQAKQSDQGRGRYRLTLQMRQPATSLLRVRVADEQQYEEAVELVLSRRDPARALQLFRSTLPTWRQLGDATYEASTLDNIGTCLYRLGDPAAAIEQYESALPRWQAAGMPSFEANTYLNLGVARHLLGDLAGASADNRRAISILQAGDDTRRLAIVLNNQALVKLDLGLVAEARELIEEAIELLRQGGDERELGRTLCNLGLVQIYQGELDQAVAVLEQALAIARSAADAGAEAVALSNLGVASDWSGDLLRAIELFRSSLALNRSIQDRAAQAEVLRNMGTTYLNLGDLDHSLSCHQQAAELNRQLGRRLEAARNLVDAGWVQALAQQPQLGVRKVELALEELAGDPQPAPLAVALEKLGRIETMLGNTTAAKTALERSLRVARSANLLRRQGKTMLGMGELWERSDRPAQAVRSFTQAGRLGRQSGDLWTTIGAVTGLSRCERGRGRLAVARSHIEQALDQIESVRARAGGRRLRASFLAARANHYELAVDLAMAQHRLQPGAGHDRAAFRFHQRLRSRSLLDTVAIRGLTPVSQPEDELRRREQQLRHRLNAGEQRLARLEPGQAGSETLRQQLLAEQANLVRHYDEVSGRLLRQQHPPGMLLGTTPLRIEEIQQQVVDPDTLLLVYALGERRSFLWSVATDSFTVTELPPRATIAAAVHRFNELLTMPMQRARITTLAERRELQQRLDRAASEYAGAAAELGMMLLEPVAEELAGRRAAIMADGLLHHLPFSALPSPVAGEEQRPLVAHHEVVTLPSASVLGLLRRQRADRSPPARTLAVLADPVLDANDPRLAGLAQPGREESTQVAAGHLLRGVPARLPFSAQEARVVSAGLAADQVLVATGFAANRELALAGRLRQYRVVHFATHGVLHERYSELSGLLLSRFDEQGQARKGFLALHDIYSLELDADLVVLSACQSGLGELVRGEGLIGLARGFFHAGAPRVVASLWPVSDAATAELMARFYDGLLHRGQRPAEALRHAQVSMLQEQAPARRHWQHPYYWAGFVLHGDWR